MSSARLLTTIAVVGAPVSLFGALYFTYKREESFVKLPIYEEALNVLRRYKPAIDYLGQPIRPKYLYPWNRTENYQGRFVAKISVPVNGSKGSGNIFIFGVRSKASDEFIIDHLDLHLDQVDKTWTFYVVKHKISLPSFDELYAKSLSVAISGVEVDDADKIKSPEIDKLKYVGIK